MHSARTPLFLAALSSLFGGAVQAQSLLTLDGVALATYKASASRIQDAKPTVGMRGVFVDGAAAAGSMLWPLASSPSPEGWDRTAFMGDIRLATRTYGRSYTDLSLPSIGTPWTIGRTYNVSSSTVANGPQGFGWHQNSAPEIVFYNDATDTEDRIYLVYGGDRFAEFQRSATSSTEYHGRNGANGVFKYVSGSPDTWVFYDTRGTRTTFFGGNTASNKADWQLWKIEDAAGNLAYVGDSATATTAVTNGYTTEGFISVAYDMADRRYTYTYSGSTIGGIKRLTKVVAEIHTGGTWASSPTGISEIARVDYDYFTTTESGKGLAGDLRMVTVRTALTDNTATSFDSVSPVPVVATTKQYFRYYTTTYSGGDPGNAHQLKLVLDPEGARNYDYNGGAVDHTLDDDFLGETDANLKAYASAYLTYTGSSDYRIKTVFFAGQCGCGGGSGSGLYTFTAAKAVTYTDTANTYNNDPALRVTVMRPDGIYESQHFDETGAPLTRVTSTGDPDGSIGTTYTTSVTRTKSVSNTPDGLVEGVATPANSTGFTEATGTSSTSTSVGKIGKPTRVLTTDSTVMAGLIKKQQEKVGTSGSALDMSEQSFSTRALSINTGTDLAKPYLTARSTSSDGTTMDNSTTVAMTWWHATSTNVLYIVPKTITSKSQKIDTSNNGYGTGSAESASVRYLRKDGTLAFSQRAEYTDAAPTALVHDYMQYNAQGLLTKQITDVKTDGSFASGDDPNTDFGITEDGNGVDITTTYTYDTLGRLDETTLPDGRVTKMYYSRLADGRLVTISIPRKTTAGGGTFYGPCSYTVSNHAGRVEASGIIAITSSGITTALTGWIDETDADPITAVDAGTLTRLSTTVYDKPGLRTSESRTYFSIPGSGAGTEGTHYDAVRMGYDSMGRNWRVKNAAGTITRTVYDSIGRMTQRWTGTNDYTFTDGEASPTDNMVKVEEIEYDGSGSPSSNKNSLVTKRTQFIQDSTTGRRDTSYYYDTRDRLITTINPAAPHSVVALDNLGRTTAMAQFSSISSPSGSNAPTTTTNRISYGTSSYDELGRTFRTRTYQINQSTGAIVQVSSVDQFLENNTWFDAQSRTIKTRGGSLVKTVYDRRGRVIDQYTLSSDNDGTTYANAFGVSGDTVLEESHSYYDENTGTVWFSHSVQRNHDDTSTTGALDSNADNARNTITAANIKGRVSITAMYYDAWNRQTDSVSYGTNAIVGDGSTNTGTYTRAGSVPSRSDTELVTTTTYDTDGTVLSTTDPRAIVTRFGYDGAGRKVTEIKNYDDGSPGGGTDDDKDQIVRYEFTAGRMTKMTADLTSNDQETIYTYGVTKGTGAGDSKISSNDLLWKVQYPESSGGSDVVAFAYNALGQELYKKDQAGNVIEQTYDTAGRITAKAATTIISGFDTTVQRIELAYLSRGLTDTVTQYDDDVSGSVLNQVKYTYDEWGNVTAIEQDRDGTVGGGGNQRSVQFGYSLVGTGDGAKRQRVQRDTTTLPNGTVTTNEFTASTIADEIGRVAKVKIGGTTLASYQYLGAGQLVGTALGTSGSDTVNRLHGGSSASYSTYLDRFGRTIKNEWFKDLSTDVPVYSIGLTYDPDSNITSVDDTLMAGYDVKYAMDKLNRLVDAEEGTLSLGTIGSPTRREQWDGGGLSPTGNWLRRKLDLNGDGDWSDTNEIDDTGTFNKANEWLTRDLDSTSGTSGNNYTLAHDAAGNMTDDGKDYKYEYDVWGRLRKVKNQSSVLVAEYFYDGLGQRTAWHADWDADGTVESSNDDPWYMFEYDDRWRIVATYRVASSATATSGTIDTYPKEQFIYHNAGMDGRGSSSYIDSVMLRDRDFSTAWTAAADSTVEERLWYGQNWRADVAVVMNSYGRPLERVKYSAYGVAMQSTALDFNNDGVIDPDDGADFIGAAYDWDLDGDVDGTDSTRFATDSSNYSAVVPSRGQVSLSSIANRKGYAGYEFDRMGERYHVRHRVYIPEMGRWTRRDPIGYVDGVDLYEYVASTPIIRYDEKGLVSQAASSRPCDGDYCDTRFISSCVVSFTGTPTVAPTVLTPQNMCLCPLRLQMYVTSGPCPSGCVTVALPPIMTQSAACKAFLAQGPLVQMNILRLALCRTLSMEIFPDIDCPTPCSCVLNGKVSSTSRTSSGTSVVVNGCTVTIAWGAVTVTSLLEGDCRPVATTPSPNPRRNP